jgi:hypothetical protein
MTRRESRPGNTEAAPQDPAADHPKHNGKGNGQPVKSAAHSVGSRQVTWWFVHEYVSPLLTDAGLWPMVGTPAWCDLADDDPVKLAAIFDAAQHWALRVETSQLAYADAGSEISAAENWSRIAQQIADHARHYIPRVTS